MVHPQVQRCESCGKIRFAEGSSMGACEGKLTFCNFLYNCPNRLMCPGPAQWFGTLRSQRRPHPYNVRYRRSHCPRKRWRWSQWICSTTHLGSPRIGKQLIVHGAGLLADGAFKAFTIFMSSSHVIILGYAWSFGWCLLLSIVQRGIYVEQHLVL